MSRARLAYQSWMLGWASAARVAAMAPPLPSVPMLRRRPRRLPAWMAAELRRHDWRMIVEAGQSLSTYDAGRWINEVDVPTSVVCTTEDRAVRPDLQRAMADAIPGATRVDIAAGHLACGRDEFAAPLLRACHDVADRTTGVGRFG
jgi:pimeloyl-ACP methyl ester carboxylesterase